MAVQNSENPAVEFFVSALGFICLIALSVQTWYFIDWLMGPSEWWLKYMTLAFFDIFGGIWLMLALFHTAPTYATFQARRVGIVGCFLLSASTTVAWCFIFITRTPLTPQAIASMVDVARWLVVVAVLGNAFLMIYYSVETKQYHQKRRNPGRRRWATEVSSINGSIVTEGLQQVPMQLAQTSSVKKKLPAKKRAVSTTP